MKMLNWMAATLCALALVACGGGGGSKGTSPFDNNSGNPTGPTVAKVDMLASGTQVGSGGDQVTVSAIVMGAGNASLAEVPVTFSTDTGILSSITAQTNENGIATAVFSAGSDKSTRTARISASAGGATGTIAIDIVGTSLALSGPTTFTLGEVATFSVKATDSRGAAIANLPLEVSSALGNGLSSASMTTDAQGNASVNYTASKAGTDTVRFSGGGTSTAPMSITISGEDFKFVSPDPNTAIAVGESRTVTVRYFKNGAAQPNVVINFAATAGTLSAQTATTDANGQASVAVSSLSAAPSTIQASFVHAGVSGSATLPVQFVATTPSSLVLQVSPSAIAPNLGGATGQQAQVLARVVDANGNPVANKTVNFSRDLDPSGGNLSQPSAVTDFNGQASVQYIAGAMSTANGGVKLRATVSGTGVAGTSSLTVNQSALFIALGTGNVIANLDEQTYRKDWVVYVTDSNGIAVPGVTLTIRVLPTRYLKGQLTWVPSAWTYAANVGPGFPGSACATEDANENGVLDAGEDRNRNGTLEPGNVISVTPGTVKTDASGRATVSLIYAESYAPWVEVKLSATAVVSGTESKKESVFIVSGSAEDFGDEKVPPAGVISPFGTVLDCSSAE